MLDSTSCTNCTKQSNSISPTSSEDTSSLESNLCSNPKNEVDANLRFDTFFVIKLTIILTRSNGFFLSSISSSGKDDSDDELFTVSCV